MEPGDWISYLEFLFEQVKLQQEVRDRWFRYYLIIAGAILGTGIAIVKLFYNTKYDQRICLVLLALSMGMGLVGLCFFMIYLRQRSNYIQHYRAITHVENFLFSMIEDQRSRQVILSPPGSDQNQTSLRELLLAARSHTIRSYGADFFTVWIHIIINSIYLASSFVFFVMLVNSKTNLSLREMGLTVAIFLLTATWLEIIRRRNFN